MNSDNIFGNDLLSGDLNTSLVPELGQDDISLNITPQESSLVNPLNQELSLTEPEIVIDEIDIDNDLSSNNASSLNSIALANIDPLIAANTEEFQVNEIDVNDTSFAPPQSELEFQGGFGDYGGNDVTLEIKDDDGNVLETFRLTGEGQATLYRDEESQYIFFSGVDETTNVDIDSTSNIKFGNYIGDSLKIETTGSINGGDIVLNDENTEVDSGLTLRAGIDTENSVSNVFDGYTLIDFYDREMVDINNFGQIVGNDDFIGRDEFFFYNGQGLYYLPGYYSSRAFGINDYGQMVGEGLPTEDDPKYKPLIAYSDGSVQEIQYVEGGGRYNADPNADEIYTYEAYGSVRDINNYLELASYQLNIPPENAPAELELTPFEDSYFLSPNGTESVNIGYELLNSENSRAFGINNPGNVVGINRETNKAFVFNREDNSVTNLGTLPGDNYSAAYAINDVGQVVGVSASDSDSRAFIYENGTMKDMGVSYVGDPESRVGIDINNLGQAVVTSAERIPFVYQDGVATNINNWLRPEVVDLGYTITEAKGINDRGQIIAQGTYDDSERGFLLNPTFQEVNRNINVGDISTFGETVLLEGAEVYLEGKSIVTQGGEIKIDGATTVNRNLIIDSSVTEDEVITGGGDITFTNTLDSSSAGVGNLRLQAGTGNILFSETVGGEASFKNINVFGANTVTANADITSDQLVRINATGDIVTQYITSDNGRVVVSSQEKSISTLDITSGNDEGDHIILQAGDSVSTKNLLANELGIVRIASGKYLEQDSNIVGDITTESITGKRIRVESTGNFTTTGDALTHDGNVVVDAKQDITVENITANNGNVRLTSEEKSLTAKDISTIIPEAVDDEETTRKGNIILKAIEGVNAGNLNANESGAVRITSGEIVENDTETLEDDTILVGDIATQSITGKRIRVDSAGSFSALGDALAHDGNVVINAKQNIIAENITADNGNVRLISEEKSVTAKDITSGSEAKGNNIIIEAIEGVKTTNLNARELGVVKIKSGDLVENDAIFVGNVVTESITGKRIDIISTGSFTATGDIIAHGGKIEVAAINDISTKNVYSLAKSINLISTKGAVTVDGDLSLLETNEDLYDLQQLKEFVLDSGEDFLIGLLAQWGRNNGSEIVLQFTDPTFVKEFEQLSKDSNAVLLGRGVADIVSIIQGLAEVSAGGTASGAGVAATPVFGGTSLVLTAGGTLVVAHGVAVGNVASADLGVVVGQLSENLTKQFFEASVDTRINVANGQTASTPLNKNGEPGKAGFQHVLEKHFNKPLSNSRSVFDISPDQLKNILQNKKLVNSQVTALPGGQYKRIVDTGQTVGKTALKFGGKPTSKITIFTDAKGNLITTYPVP